MFLLCFKKSPLMLIFRHIGSCLLLPVISCHNLRPVFFENKTWLYKSQISAGPRYDCVVVNTPLSVFGEESPLTLDKTKTEDNLNVITKLCREKGNKKKLELGTCKRSTAIAAVIWKCNTQATQWLRHSFSLLVKASVFRHVCLFACLFFFSHRQENLLSFVSIV